MIEAYRMYLDFARRYHDVAGASPPLSLEKFEQQSIFYFDCSNQDDSLKISTCDLKIELEASENFPAETRCYALVFHDALLSYNSLTGDVERII